jgi:hypothetical protein
LIALNHSNLVGNFKYRLLANIVGVIVLLVTIGLGINSVIAGRETDELRSAVNRHLRATQFLKFAFNAASRQLAEWAFAKCKQSQLSVIPAQAGIQDATVSVIAGLETARE